jgi:hypothetical protein
MVEVRRVIALLRFALRTHSGFAEKTRFQRALRFHSSACSMTSDLAKSSNHQNPDRSPVPDSCKMSIINHSRLPSSLAGTHGAEQKAKLLKETSEAYRQAAAERFTSTAHRSFSRNNAADEVATQSDRECKFKMMKQANPKLLSSVEPVEPLSEAEAVEPRDSPRRKEAREMYQSVAQASMLSTSPTRVPVDLRATEYKVVSCFIYC